MKADFYVLDQAGHQKALLFVCRLVEQLSNSCKQIYIYAASKEEAERLDTLLWTYRDDSFLPHAMYHPADDFPPPIQIGYEAYAPDLQQQTIINLSKSIPSFYQQFQQIIEIVFPDPLVQQLGREKFRQYRAFGFEITTHKINAHELN